MAARLRICRLEVVGGQKDVVLDSVDNQVASDETWWLRDVGKCSQLKWS